MFQANTSVFVGKDRSSGFRDHIAEDGFFFMFEVEDGMTKTEGHAFMKDVKRRKDEKGDIRTLGDLEVWINGLANIKSIPAHFSIACGAQVDDIIYLQTVGQGEIHLRRGKDFVRLIHGEKSASGYIKEGDMFVFTTSTFRAMVEEEEALIEPMDKNPPAELVSALEDYYDKKNDLGSSSIFAQFSMNAAPAKAGKKSALKEDAAERMGFSTDEEGADDASQEEDIKHKPNYHSRAVQSTEVEDDDAEDASGDEEALGGTAAGAAGIAGAGAATEAIGGAVVGAGAGIPRRSGLPVMEMPDENIQTDAAPKKNFFSKLKFSLPESKLSKKTSRLIMIAILIVLGGIIVWSVVLGNQRRMAAQAQKRIQATEMEVDRKTARADEQAFLNLDESTMLLAQAKKEVTDLEKEVGPGYAADIKRLNKKITDKENEIMHKDEKEPEEFYDLALENKNAAGNAMYLEKDNIAILDSENKTIYNLSAEKKSITKSKNDILSDATRVGMVKGVLFAFVPGKGLYEFTDDTKTKKVIDNDKDWGDIKDIGYFAGNIYMLDGGKQDILKYTLIADGYAPKTSYFKGEKPDLTDAISMKIDSSVYVASVNDVLKFTSGEADDFKVSFPTTKVDIQSIYTDENAKKVYAWDRTNATVFVLAKNGTYEKQIKASVLAKASDVIAYKDDILVLVGSKIYKLNEADAKEE
jgi:hypothetical protein